jgi:lysyl-tRNA synthetase class 2
MSNNVLTQCPLQRLKQRAFLLAKIRQYFASENVLEVETPILSSAGNTDIHIESFTSNPIQANSQQSYLRTSPEFPLKRLLCSGVGDIYELGKVFRREEISKTHNVEFTLLEWYRLGFDYLQLIHNVKQLFECILSSFNLPSIDSNTMTFAEAFNEFLDCDISQINLSELNKICTESGYSGSYLTKEQAMDYLFATQIQPQFDKQQLTFVTHYPANQAALAQINPKDPTTALRFEVFYQGHELGNGYQELTDAQELSLRFKQDNVYRAKHNQQTVVVDENLLSAIQRGMPKCSGIAIGVDRLLMTLIESGSIDEVLSFGAHNA